MDNSLIVHNAKAAALFNSLPLKEMDGAMLLAELMIQLETKLFGKVNYDKITSAISFAALLHRNAMRANRANLPKTPYIEHPLRNTIRVVRLGIADENIITACLLHDVIEDNSEDIVMMFTDLDYLNMNEHEIRLSALEYLADVYSEEAAQIVEAVSNPVKNPGLTLEEKNVQYLNHFKEISSNPSALIVKLMDLIDNAGSLNHTKDILGDASTKKKAIKYLPVLEEIVNNIHSYDLTSMLNETQIQIMANKFKTIFILNYNFANSEL